MGMSKRGALLAVCLAAVPGGAALADYDPSQYPAYETCALCHGLFGQSHTAKFPNLGAQRPAYIEAQLMAFIDARRTNDGGQMAAIVTELMPEDIPLVVEWFSTQDAPTPYEAVDTNPGLALFADLGCLTCHTNSADTSSDVPYLTAQHPGYLLKQMQDFREGRRTSHAVAPMHAEILARPDADLQAIAIYLGAEPRP